jgi:hypothetical protein
MSIIKQDSEDVTEPEFIRLPRNNRRCPYTGLSRSTLNGLILATKENGFKPTVRSLVLKKRGAIRGVRLIVYASLIDYLRSLDEQNTPCA